LALSLAAKPESELQQGMGGAGRWIALGPGMAHQLVENNFSTACATRIFQPSGRRNNIEM